jgi:predicted amidohydrolase
MKLGVFQFSPAFGDKEGNLGRIGSALGSAEGDLVVLPELCTTGYRFVAREEAFDLSEPVSGGRTTEILSGICRDRGLHLALGMAERCGDACYNSAVLIGPGGWIGTYRKVHLFQDEKRWFSPGSEGFPVFDLGFASVGLMVCFDWIFPEAARTLALSGADLICHPSNLVLPYCPDAMITRSIENRVFTATANRTGAEERGGAGRLVFIGSSQITDPSGKVLVRMDREEEGLSFVQIDPQRARDKRITPMNHLWEDRKADQYGVRL